MQQSSHSCFPAADVLAYLCLMLCEVLLTGLSSGNCRGSSLPPQYYLHVVPSNCSLPVLEVFPAAISSHSLIQDVMVGRNIPIQVLLQPLPGFSPLCVLGCPPSRSIALVGAGISLHPGLATHVWGWQRHRATLLMRGLC